MAAGLAPVMALLLIRSPVSNKFWIC